MRLTKEKTAENRDKIVKTAAKLFRERGVDSVGLNDVMAEAGFTHGGFYNHFSSKEDLTAAAMASAFEESLASSKKLRDASKDPDSVFAKSLLDYLTPAHRDDLCNACPTAILPTDAARHGKDVQAVFAKGLTDYLEVMVERIGKKDRATRVEAMSVLSMMVGSMILARAVHLAEPKLSDEFLSAARARLRKNDQRTETRKNERISAPRKTRRARDRTR